MSHRPDTKPFKDLFNNPEDFERVFSRIEHIIWSSFAIDAKVFGRQPEVTDEKIKHRWGICEKWFRHMRGEIGFGLTETLDMLAKALACELLDIPFEPKKRENVGWAAESVDSVLKRS